MMNSKEHYYDLYKQEMGKLGYYTTYKEPFFTHIVLCYKKKKSLSTSIRSLVSKRYNYFKDNIGAVAGMSWPDHMGNPTLFVHKKSEYDKIKSVIQTIEKKMIKGNLKLLQTDIIEDYTHEERLESAINKINRFNPNLSEVLWTTKLCIVLNMISCMMNFNRYCYTLNIFSLLMGMFGFSIVCWFVYLDDTLKLFPLGNCIKTKRELRNSQ